MTTKRNTKCDYFHDGRKRIADFEAAYLAINGERCRVVYRDGWYRVRTANGSSERYRGRQIDRMTASYKESKV